jgi:hypothetical protein
MTSDFRKSSRKSESFIYSSLEKIEKYWGKDTEDARKNPPQGWTE